MPEYTWLHRPRLLRFVPEERGYVLRLGAPYGFGKSVLLAQASVYLKDLGFRVVQASGRAGSSSLLAELCATLGLPSLARRLPASWPEVLLALEEVQTAVLLDDLPVDGSLSGLHPLLQALPGPLILASRGSLADPVLLTLQAEGRLTSLSAAQLAFSTEEAEHLAGRPGKGAALWNETFGWPLALHLGTVGSLEAAGGEALRQGISESLSPALLSRLRVAAALDGLPGLAVTSSPEFLGLLGESGRPSPLVGRLFSSGTETEREVRLALREAAPDLCGAAYERLGWNGDLAALLESSPGLGQLAPEAVLRWDSLLPTGGPARDLEVAWALVRAGDLQGGAARFGRLARNPQATQSQRLDAYGNAAFYLAESDLGAAQALITQAGPLLAGAGAEEQAQFMNRAAHVDYLAGHLEQGVERLSQALILLPVLPATRLRSNIAVNLAMQRWWLSGDSDAHLAVRERELAAWGNALPGAVRLSHRWNLGITALLGGLPGVARRHFLAALEDQASHPLYALHCRCFLELQEGPPGGHA